MLSQTQSVPLIHEVDVLVIGAGSGAVAAALAARDAGARVVAISDRSYFGDESAGALRLDGGRGCDDPLYQQLFPAESAFPPPPGRVKHTLTRALLAAGVPFLFYARPVAILRDGAGTLCGVVVASRTSLYAIGCRAVIDATRQGLLARLAGVSLPGRRQLPSELEWVVLSPDVPQSLHFRVSAAGAFQIAGPKDEAIQVPAHRLALPRPTHDDSIAGRAGTEHRIRAALAHPTIWGLAETIPDRAARHTDAALVEDVTTIAPDQLHVGDGVILANSLLPLSDTAVSALEDPAVQIPLGRRAGQAAAERARSRSAATDWSTVVADAGRGEITGPFGFAPGFVRRGTHVRHLSLSIPPAPLLGSCDVLVAGGGTAGASAGISAARAGARTIVLETLHGLGGVGTLGLIACYWFGNRVGFSNELDRRVKEVTGVDTSGHNARWNPDVKDLCYQKALLEAGGSAWLGSFAYGVRREGDRVTGLLVSTPFGSGLLEAGAVIDATGNADIAAAAGAPCRTIDHRHVAVQGAGLPSRKPGVDYRNTDYTFIDDSDPVGVTHAFVNAQAKFSHEFDIAPLADTRERRQIHGEIELSPLDMLAGRTFPDTIVTARSNFDTHGFTVHPVFIAVPPDKQPRMAHVPFRSMLPRGVDGVLVTGLGISAHRDALPVVRMQADVQNQGYGAGLAAARSAASGAPLRQLDLRALQKDLVAAGILDPEVATHEDSFPLPPEAIKAAVEAGPVDSHNAAVLVAHPRQSLPALRAALATADAGRREAIAELLGLMGDAAGAEILAELVSGEPWDEGWNFTGMGQFGRSMSRMDGLIVALAGTGSGIAVEPIVAKIRQLDASAAFSHCRAASVATSMLADAALKTAVAQLLALPGVQGHAHLATAQVISSADDNWIETATRNLSLRELLLARGLYLAGDVDGLGRRILETYAADLRGPYARHAGALLDVQDLESARREAI